MNGLVEYPPFWQSDDEKKEIDKDYGKVHMIDLLSVASDDALAAIVQVVNRFYQSVDENNWEIIKVEAIQNQRLYDKYWNERVSMIKLMGSDMLNELDLFHGTGSEHVMMSISKEGFRKEFNIKGVYGKGTYFARNAKYSIDYSHKGYDAIYKMFCCRVMCGESTMGSKHYELKDWPKKPDGLIYDSLVNNINDPSIYVIHENIRAYPMFIIHFRKKYYHDIYKSSRPSVRSQMTHNQRSTNFIHILD